MSKQHWIKAVVEKRQKGSINRQNNPNDCLNTLGSTLGLFKGKSLKFLFAILVMWLYVACKINFTFEVNPCHYMNMFGCKRNNTGPFCSPLGNRVWSNEPFSSSGFIGRNLQSMVPWQVSSVNFDAAPLPPVQVACSYIVWNDIPTRNGLM